MEEKEAQRQRKLSMSNSDFKPEYLQHILNDEEEEMYQHEMEQVEVRFLNVGAYVIPLINPKFMSDLVGPSIPNNNNMNMDDDNNEDMRRKVDELEEKLDDMNYDLQTKERQIKMKDERINNLKGENEDLKKHSSRQSLSEYEIKTMVEDTVDKKEYDRLKKEMESQRQYIEKLSFYMKENNDIIIPTPKQLKKKMKHKLNTAFRKRPSINDLQAKLILSSNFISDATNQDAQIAEKRLRFRRTSDLIESFLHHRPSRQRLEEINNKLFILFIF